MKKGSNPPPPIGITKPQPPPGPPKMVKCYRQPPQHWADELTQEAQRLMDELWDCGLRPSEGTGSAGSLAATERHLKDMQTIAMGLLRKEGVGA